MTQSIEALFGYEEEAKAEGALASLGKSYLSLRDQMDDLNARKKALQDQIDAAESQLTARLEAEKLTSIRLKEALITLTTKSYYRMPGKNDPEKRRAVLRWLGRVGAKDLIDVSILPQTLTKFCRERQEEGKSISPDVVATPLRSIAVRKS